MQDINEEQLSIPILDLGAATREEVNESYLTSMGGIIKFILRRMFAPGSGPNFFRVRGTRPQINSFLDTLTAEKKYLSSFSKFGLHSPMTYKNSRQLAGAVRGFEKETGLKWPFK
tara:strand:+ start:244 stop:588 length:345 start_codon:yes stop_codon:yes gene_type:complete